MDHASFKTMKPALSPQNTRRYIFFSVLSLLLAVCWGYAASAANISGIHFIIPSAQCLTEWIIRTFSRMCQLSLIHSAA
jgi:hypothetical protein